MLAEYLFGLHLNPPSTAGHDARWIPEAEGSTAMGDAVTVEIKCTQRNSVSFYSSDFRPDHILVLRLNRGFAPDVVYNGPGNVVLEHLNTRALQKNGQVRIGVAALRKLDAVVDDANRLPYRRRLGAGAKRHVLDRASDTLTELPSPPLRMSLSAGRGREPAVMLITTATTRSSSHPISGASRFTVG